MDELPVDVILIVASFECAYELSLLSNSLKRTISDNMSTLIIDRLDGFHSYDDLDDDDIPYTDVGLVYEVGKLRRADHIATDHVLWQTLYEYSERAVEDGTSRMWDTCNATDSISTMVSVALREIHKAWMEEDDDAW